MSRVKQQVQQLADTLPEDATWEQVRYEVHVREQIEEGERAIAEGRTLRHDEVKKRFPCVGR
jgi:predicted transcriptional regulator